MLKYDTSVYKVVDDESFDFSELTDDEAFALTVWIFSEPENLLGL